MRTPTSLKPMAVRVAGLESEVSLKRGELVRMANGGGGGACSCVTVHEIRTDGTVSGGTFNLDVTINDADGNSVTETLGTFAWNVSAATAKTEYETHSEIATGDIAVLGGNFPDAALYVVFRSTGTLNRHQPVPVPDSSSITGGGRIKTQQVTSVDWEYGL